MASTGASSSSTRRSPTVADDIRTGVYVKKYVDGTTDVKTGSKLTKGTMICLESTLMSIRDHDAVKVYTEYLSLSREDRALYDSLPMDPAKELVFESQIKEFVRKDKGREKKYSELLTSAECLSTAAKAMARFKYNARCQIGTELTDVTRMSSFIQHDCNPNAILSYRSKTNMWAVYAIRDIAAGDNILTSYIEADCTLPLAERKEALLKEAILECPCAACGRPTSGHDQEEIDRLKLHVFGKVLADVVPEQRRGFVSTYEQMLAVLSPRPEFSELECEVHHTLAEIFAERGDLTRAIASIAKAVELATVCYGSDGDITHSMIQLKNDFDAKDKAAGELEQAMYELSL